MKPTRDYSKAEIEAAIDEWIVMHRNAERNRELCKKHMIDGRSFESLAEEYGMSVRGVQYAIYRCQDILFRHIKVVHRIALSILSRMAPRKRGCFLLKM